MLRIQELIPLRLVDHKSQVLYLANLMLLQMRKPRRCLEHRSCNRGKEYSVQKTAPNSHPSYRQD